MPATPRDLLPALLHLAAVAAVLFVSGGSAGSLPAASAGARALGWSLIAAGVALVVWAGAHLRRGLLGGVEPRAPRLVTGGPFRRVRHPVYLGLITALAGVPVVLASGWGLAAFLLLFLPAAVYRARMEDRALALRFGREWAAWAERTGFLVPRRPLRAPP